MSTTLKACHCCGLVQWLPAVPQGFRARCPRCRSTVHLPRGAFHYLRLTSALSGAALILYPLAISLPVMRVERFGHQTEASIWTGTFNLLESGQVFVGTVVLLCSILLPCAKLVGLFLITGGRAVLSRRHKALTYRLIEWTGRWGMLDVLLIALVVAWLKLGNILHVTPGPGALTFTIFVLLSLSASASFDPHALWEENEGKA